MENNNNVINELFDVEEKNKSPYLIPVNLKKTGIILTIISIITLLFSINLLSEWIKGSGYDAIIGFCAGVPLAVVSVVAFITGYAFTIASNEIEGNASTQEMNMELLRLQMKDELRETLKEELDHKPS